MFRTYAVRKAQDPEDEKVKKKHPRGCFFISLQLRMDRTESNPTYR